MSVPISRDGSFTNSDVDSSEQLTVVTIPDGATRLYVHFEVTTTLTGFSILATPHPGASAYDTLYSVSTDFTSPTGVLIGCGTSDGADDLTIVADGESGWFIMDVSGMASVKLMAAGTSSVVAGYWRVA